MFHTSLIQFINLSLFSAYSCRLISLLCVVLFKTGDSSQEIREKAAQLIFILDRYINMTYFLRKSPPLKVDLPQFSLFQNFPFNCMQIIYFNEQLTTINFLFFLSLQTLL